MPKLSTVATPRTEFSQLTKQRHDSRQSSLPAKAKKAVSFNYFGAKTSLGPDIFKRSPLTTGGKFVDVCTGRANLTWQAWALGLQFKEWVLNDTLLAPFFCAIRDVGDKVRVPVRSREEF